MSYGETIIIPLQQSYAREKAAHNATFVAKIFFCVTLYFIDIYEKTLNYAYFFSQKKFANLQTFMVSYGRFALARFLELPTA